ncbi:MAG: inositol monophosphatase [Clostridiales bacterium]|nr:inositol monophosphatase [Clostridiales bacterium]
MENCEFTKEINFMKKLVVTAYKKIIKGKPFTVEIKKGSIFNCDQVTDKDLAIEKYIKEKIQETFPGDKIIAEEFSAKEKCTGRSWILDPIDGTVNFAHNIAMWGIQSAFTVDGDCKFAVIYIPSLDELYVADSTGLKINNKKVVVNKDVPLGGSLLSLSSFEIKNKPICELQQQMYLALAQKVAQVKQLGSSSYEYTQVASSRNSCYVIFTNNIWDYLPGLFVCKQAGCAVFETVYKGKQMCAVAANEEILEAVKKAYNTISKKLK